MESFLEQQENNEPLSTREVCLEGVGGGGGLLLCTNALCSKTQES